jgi:heme/copper-type cytochrome/quinol oxidase subunit 2
VSDFLFNFIGFSLLGAVGIVLILGIYTLFKGGDTSKKYSNKLMQLRVLLQFIAVIILVLMAYLFKN